MTITTSRRAFVAGVPAVAIAAVPAVALTGDDSELLALLSDAEAVDRASDATAAEQERLHKLAEPHYPPEPQWTAPPAEYAHIWEKEPSYKFEMLAADHPLKVWCATAYESERPLRQAHRDAYGKVTEQFGIREVEAQWEDQRYELDGLVRQIIATPARTLAGVLAKFRAHELSCAEDEESLAGVLKSIEADIQAMVGKAVQS